MVYFSDVVFSKNDKRVFFSAKISKICLLVCLRGVFFCKIGSVVYFLKTRIDFADVLTEIAEPLLI